MVFEGGCYCKALRYRAEGEPTFRAPAGRNRSSAPTRPSYRMIPEGVAVQPRLPGR
jgi:hypothetical protein